jgi:hypothetical protein
VRVTENEADAMASNCGSCWAEPGAFCTTPSGRARKPHTPRVNRARRRGLMDGVGRAYLMARHKLPGHLDVTPDPAGQVDELDEYTAGAMTDPAFREAYQNAG